MDSKNFSFENEINKLTITQQKEFEKMYDKVIDDNEQKTQELVNSQNDLSEAFARAYSKVSEKVENACSSLMKYFNDTRLNNEFHMETAESKEKLYQLQECVRKNDDGFTDDLEPFDIEAKKAQYNYSLCLDNCARIFKRSNSEEETMNCITKCYSRVVEDNITMINKSFEKIKSRI